MVSRADAVLRFAVEDDTQGGLRSITSGLDGIRGAAGGIGIAVGAAAGAFEFFRSGLASQVDYLNEIRPLLARGGFLTQGAEEAQVMAEAIELAGSEAGGLDALAEASQELQLQLGEAIKEGKSRASDDLRDLGFDYVQLAERIESEGPLPVIQDIIAALREVEDISTARFMAEEIFGGTGFEQMSAYLFATNEEFARVNELAPKTARVMSDEVRPQIQGMDEDLRKLNAEWQYFKDNLTADAAPLVSALADFLDEYEGRLAIARGLEAWSKVSGLGWIVNAVFGTDWATSNIRPEGDYPGADTFSRLEDNDYLDAVERGLESTRQEGVTRPEVDLPDTGRLAGNDYLDAVERGLESTRQEGIDYTSRSSASIELPRGFEFELPHWYTDLLGVTGEGGTFPTLGAAPQVNVDVSVQVDGSVTVDDLDNHIRGVVIEGVRLGVINA